MKILFVDDEEGAREQGKIYLEKEDESFKVETAESAEKALEKTEDETYDVIVSDYKMPEMDGIDFLEELRARGLDIPFIILTGKGKEEVVIEALNLGADRYLRKGREPQSQYNLLARAIRQEHERKETELELKESQRTLSTLVSNLPGMAYRCKNDESWTMEFVSEGCIELTGYQPWDLIQNKTVSFKEIIHEDDRVKVRRKIEKAVKKKEDYELEYRINTAHDGVKWVREHGVGVFEGDELEALEGIIMDVTEKKQAKLGLKYNKNKTEQLHEVASKLSRCEDESEAYQQAIEAAENILDFDFCSIEEVREGYFEPKAVSSKLDLDDSTRRAVEEGGIDRKTYQNKRTYLVEDSRNRDDVEPISKEPEMRSAISVPIDEIGIFQATSQEPDYFDEEDVKMADLLISHLSNTIQHIRFERELKEKEKLYRTIFENTGTAMAILDEDGTISLANEKFDKLIGYYEDDAEGNNFLELVVEQDKSRVERYREEMRKDKVEAPRQYDLQIETKQGGRKHILMTAGLISGTGQEVASLLDVSDREELYKGYKELVSRGFKQNQDMIQGYLDELERTELTQDQESTLEKLRASIEENQQVIQEIQEKLGTVHKR